MTTENATEQTGEVKAAETTDNEPKPETTEPDEQSKFTGEWRRFLIENDCGIPASNLIRYIFAREAEDAECVRSEEFMMDVLLDYLLCIRNFLKVKQQPELLEAAATAEDATEEDALDQALKGERKHRRIPKQDEATIEARHEVIDLMTMNSCNRHTLLDMARAGSLGEFARRLGTIVSSGHGSEQERHELRMRVLPSMRKACLIILGDESSLVE